VDTSTGLTIPGPSERRLQRDLEAVVRRHLMRRGLDDPTHLGQALGTSTGDAAVLLRRPSWPVEVSLGLVDALGVAVSVQVDARPRRAAG
jgi:hypothetical protein